MKEQPIGFFDSGIGGITILKEALLFFPQENMIYYGDSAHNPYGDKSQEEVIHLVDEGVQFLLSKHCKLIVIACNTATGMAIDAMRKKYPEVLFVATVPALKVALTKTEGNVLVLATTGTLQSNRFLELMQQVEREKDRIFLLPCPGLADLIEEGNTTEIDRYLAHHLTKYREKEIDTVVLGCTHYPLIKDKIQAILGPVILVDGSLGICKRLLTLLEENDLATDSTETGSVTIYNSAGSDKVTRTYERLEEYEI